MATTINLDFATNAPLKIRKGAKATFTATFAVGISLVGKDVLFRLVPTDAEDTTPVIDVTATVAGQVATFVISTAESNNINTATQYVWTVSTVDGDNEVEVYATGKVIVTSINHL